MPPAITWKVMTAMGQGPESVPGSSVVSARYGGCSTTASREINAAGAAIPVRAGVGDVADEVRVGIELHAALGSAEAGVQAAVVEDLDVEG